jgi:O-acetyl-ADP-ribose deacetylase (regulator of RNase III)
MRLVFEKGLKSIAFPSISTGVYGYPVEEASRVAVGAVREFLDESGWRGEVLFVAFSDHDYAVYTGALAEVA